MFYLKQKHWIFFGIDKLIPLLCFLYWFWWLNISCTFCFCGWSCQLKRKQKKKTAVKSFFELFVKWRLSSCSVYSSNERCLSIAVVFWHAELVSIWTGPCWQLVEIKRLANGIFFFFFGDTACPCRNVHRNPPPPKKKILYKQLFGLLWRNLSCQSNIMTTCTPNCLIVAECKKKRKSC